MKRRIDPWLAILGVWLCLLGRAPVSAGAETGWETTRIVGVELTSQPVAMQWDAKGYLWLLESVAGPAGPRSRLLRVEFPEDTWSRAQVALVGDDLPEATGFEVAASGIWLAAPSRLLWISDADGKEPLGKSQPLVGWGTPSGHGAVVRGLHRHRDGWIYAVLQSADYVTPQALGKGVSVPAKLAPGVIRFHPGYGVVEQYAEGPTLALDLDFDARGNLVVLTSSREALFHVVKGGCYVTRNQYPRPLNPFLDVSEGLLGSEMKTFGYAGLVAGGVGAMDVLWLRHSNATAWMPLQSVAAGSTLQVRPTAAMKSLIGRVEAAPQSGVQGPVDSLFFRVNGGLVRITPQGWIKAVEKSPGLRSVPSMAGVLDAWNGADRWTERQIDRRLLDADETAALAFLEGSWSSLAVARRRAQAVEILAARSRASNQWMSRAAVDADDEVRLQVARAIGEHGLVSPEAIQILTRLAADADPKVRREVAIAARVLAPDRTKAGKTKPALELNALFQILDPLTRSAARQPDRLCESLIWAALEPVVASSPTQAVARLTVLGDAAISVTGPLLRKTVWRAFTSADDRAVDRVLDQLLALADTSPALCAFGLEGMMQGQKSSKAWAGSKSVKRLLRKLSESQSPELAGAAQRVEALCGNPKSQEAIVAKISRSDVPERERIRAIEFARLVPSDEARAALLDCLRGDASESVKRAAVESLQDVGTLTDAGVLVPLIGPASPEMRAALVAAFESRETWWPALLGGLESGKVPRSAVSARFEAVLRAHPNTKLRARAMAALGLDAESSR